MVRTLRDCDTIETINDEIHISIDGVKYSYGIADVTKIAILTTDQGPFVDDTALLMVVKESYFLIPSEHHLYAKFLFDEISKKITIDFQKAVDASACTENAEFVLYTK